MKSIHIINNYFMKRDDADIRYTDFFSSVWYGISLSFTSKKKANLVALNKRKSCKIFFTDEWKLGNIDYEVQSISPDIPHGLKLGDILFLPGTEAKYA